MGLGVKSSHKPMEARNSLKQSPFYLGRKIKQSMEAVLNTFIFMFASLKM